MDKTNNTPELELSQQNPTLRTLRQHVPQREPLTARAYPNRVPDGEYIAVCTHVHHDQQSRNYGERVYLDFQIYDGEYQGKTIRMFLRPSVFPTSNFYRAWAIAHGGPPRSRNTKMSPRIFVGKLFRIQTATVRPRQRVTGEDGKSRPGPFLPETFWYSKVAYLLDLEVTNERIPENVISSASDALPESPVILTDFSSKPFSSTDLSKGRVGRRELGDGSKRESELAVRDGITITALHNQPVGSNAVLPAPSPQCQTGPRAESDRQKQILREGGLL